MDIQREREAFERFKAKQIGIDYETLKKDLDDCEKRFPNNRYAGWNFKSDWDLWQAAKQQAIPDGFVVVPVGPTQEMIDKAVSDTPETPSQDYWHSSQPINDDQATVCYKAMIQESQK